jgi:Mg2+ and Co2+ transporter CorA
LAAVEDPRAFFFGCRPELDQSLPGHVKRSGKDSSGEAPSVRWVHVDATKGLDRLTLLRLAVKYHLHPLAVDDVLNPKTQTKVDRYADSYFIGVEVVALAYRSRHFHKGVPSRVRIHRSHVSIFLSPLFDTLVTIHQEREDESSWLALWRHDASADAESNSLSLRTYSADEELDNSQAAASMCICGSVFMPDAVYCRKCGQKRSGAASCTDLWTQLAGGLENEPIPRVREEAGDFLLYEILQRVVAELQPLVQAYAFRLGFMHQQPVRRITQAWLAELGEVQLELADVKRSLRPMRQVVRQIKGENSGMGSSCRMYLQDVDNTIDALHDDVDQLTLMARSLEEAHQKFADKRMNDTLFALSVISAIFLPAQFFTGLYGMNFVDSDGEPGIPELKFKHGYAYFWVVQAIAFCTAIAIVSMINTDTWSRIPVFCRRCATCCSSYLSGDTHSAVSGSTAMNNVGSSDLEASTVVPFRDKEFRGKE